MEISDVKKQIKTDSFLPVYIFHGPEHTIMKIYLKMIAEKGGYEISYVDSLMDLMTGVKTKSLVPVHHLYIIMDDKEFMTNEKMWSQFKGLKDDIVVFYYTTTDKRLKFWKHFKTESDLPFPTIGVVEFSPLDVTVLTKYIKKEIPLSDKSCEKLIDVCSNDYGRILLEIDKIKHYMYFIEQYEDLDCNEVFEQLLTDGTIYRQPKDAIFDFVSAFLERNPVKAYNLLEQSKRVGEASLVMISVLYNSIKTLLQIQSAKDYKKLGLNGFAIKNVIGYRNNYSNGELVRAMKLLRECEIGIKTGAVPDELAVDYFLVQVL